VTLVYSGTSCSPGHYNKTPSGADEAAPRATGADNWQGIESEVWGCEIGMPPDAGGQRAYVAGVYPARLPARAP
jgi:hypothetical protein